MVVIHIVAGKGPNLERSRKLKNLRRLPQGSKPAEKKERVNHIKIQLLEAQQSIAELLRLIPSSPVTSSSS